jgi:hypothetical protein
VDDMINAIQESFKCAFGRIRVRQGYGWRSAAYRSSRRADDTVTSSFELSDQFAADKAGRPGYEDDFPVSIDVIPGKSV